MAPKGRWPGLCLNRRRLAVAKMQHTAANKSRQTRVCEARQRRRAARGCFQWVANNCMGKAAGITPGACALEPKFARQAPHVGHAKAKRDAHALCFIIVNIVVLTTFPYVLCEWCELRKLFWPQAANLF